MKINFDKEKSAEVISGLVHNTVDISKKAATSAKTNVLSMVEKTKNEAYARKLKKYNPLFPQQYSDESFNLPNMIIIVDDAVRRGIDVCEGSIGWLGKQSGVEILYLYDEAVSFSGLQFIPSATCDSVYYVDSFDRSRFIRIDCIFSKAHEERMAELKHIAHSLGAKRCTIEIAESNSITNSQVKEMSAGENIKGVSTTEETKQSFSSNESNQRSGRIVLEFEGSDTPTKPNLKWFAFDDNIKRLIEMRCSGSNQIKTEMLELSGASSATMSRKTAYAIDSAVGKMSIANGDVSMDVQAAKEHHSKLLLHIEF